MTGDDNSRDINDVNNFSGRLRSQVELVQDMDVDEDREAILRWLHTMDVADTTLIDRLKNVRLMSSRADKRLVDMDKSDVLALFADMADGSHPGVPADGLGNGTIRQYRQAARLFFRDELDRDWGGDIVIGQTERSPIGPDQILTSDEVDDLLDACEDPRNSAIISFLCVTGQRITATLSIRVGDVELDQRQATVRLNSDAKGLKGASGPRPVLWARPYIANWLDNHPLQYKDNAPLFCATQSGWRPHEDGGKVSWEKGEPLSRSQVHNQLKKVARRADVPTEKVKPHNFRHTAITRMRDEGIPDDRIRFMVGVEPDSDILERYDTTTNQKMMNRVREDHGMATEEEVTVGRPSLEECNQCGTSLRGNSRFCPQCGAPLNVDAHDDIEEVKADIDETIPDAMAELDASDVETLLETKRKLNEPGVQAFLEGRN